MSAANRSPVEHSAAGELPAGKIKQSGLYGKFNTMPRLPSLDDQVTILGLTFNLVDLNEVPNHKTPCRRVVFIIEDIMTGLVTVQESFQRAHGLKLIQEGKLGKIFVERFGQDFRGKVRVWCANTSVDVEKYNIETYLLPRLVDKRAAKQRTAVMTRNYKQLDTDMRAYWRCRYPYAAEVVLKDHEDYHLGRT